MASTEFVDQRETPQGIGECIFKFSNGVARHFILIPPAGCLRYFGHVSLPRNFRTRAGIGAQPRKIRRERI